MNKELIQLQEDNNKKDDIPLLKGEVYQSNPDQGNPFNIFAKTHISKNNFAPPGSNYSELQSPNSNRSYLKGHQSQQSSTSPNPLMRGLK